MTCGWRWKTQGRLEPMWVWRVIKTRNTRDTKQCADVLTHRARCTLCSCACWWTSGHSCPHWSWRCCCRHSILRSHFCRDFLYQEMYSLHILCFPSLVIRRFAHAPLQQQERNNTRRWTHRSAVACSRASHSQHVCELVFSVDVLDLDLWCPN